MKVLVFGWLLLGFLLLFWKNRLPQKAGALLEKTKWGIDAASRQRVLENRRDMEFNAGSDFWLWLERELYYSGVKLRFPKVTAEYWAAINLAAAALMLVLGMPWGFQCGLASAAVLLVLEKAILELLKQRNMRSVNEQLLKLLDFLGNYSVTSGEVTGVLLQVSRYVENPLKAVLEGCYYEAQTTGEVSGALLAMSEKVEHPKFKELVGNMEVSIRYCADFSALVSGSKRSVREYMRNAGERRGMLRESVISMLLLLGMSMLVLLAVGNLVQTSVAELLVGSWPGRIGMAVIVGVGIMFLGQLRKLHY